MGINYYINGKQMKFTIALAALLGYSQAITIWTTKGTIAYEAPDDDDNLQIDDYHPGQSGTMGAASYARVVPARFSGDSDDIFMRSMISNYAIEAANKDGSPTGNFYMTPATTRAAASEVLCTHKGLCGAALKKYLATYFDKAWGHFDVNKSGSIEVIRTPQLMRFLASDQYVSM